jgi:hypothetical protein
MMRLFVPGAVALILVSFSACFDEDIVTVEDIVVVDDADPPEIVILTPSDGDTAYCELPVVLQVEDESLICKVMWYADGEQIDNSARAPFESVWYAGYWAAEERHELWAAAEDAAGNVGYSDTLSLFVSPDARFAPQVFQPDDSIYIAPTTTLTFKCAPCPGAHRYLVEWHCRNCACWGEWCGNIFLISPNNQVFAFVKIMGDFHSDLEIEWKMRAEWDDDHVSEWSETRLLMIRASVPK